MIKLTRNRANPPVHENFFGVKRVRVNLKLLKQKRDGKLDAPGDKKWDSNFWKESKAQLLVESHNKCAYCDTPTRVVAYGDVEHFRPKSHYWWLAYSYENYLPACIACNQEYKKDFFALADAARQLPGPAIDRQMTDAALQVLAPQLTVDPVDDTQGMRLQTFLAELKREKALLINPYVDDPAVYLAYQPILETREVFIIPTKPRYKKVVEACENLFGINRKELLDLRFQWYCMYMTFRQTLADPGISNQTRLRNENRLREMEAENSPYAGMIRYLQSQPLAELPWDDTIL